MAMLTDLRLTLRLFGVALGLMLLPFAFGAPASAHTGAHMPFQARMAPAKTDAATADDAAATRLAAADQCDEDCGCCCSGAMHMHCHGHAMLMERPDLRRHPVGSRSGWGLSPGADVATSGNTPPVPPPNAG
jgi:hypothetical protein